MLRKKKKTATLVPQDDVTPVFVLGDMLETDTPPRKVADSSSQRFASLLSGRLAQWSITSSMAIPEVHKFCFAYCEARMPSSDNWC